MDILRDALPWLRDLVICALLGWLWGRNRVLELRADLFDQRLKAEHQRVDALSQQAINFMKIVHSKWDSDDMAALKNGVGPVSVEASAPNT